MTSPRFTSTHIALTIATLACAVPMMLGQGCPDPSFTSDSSLSVDAGTDGTVEVGGSIWLQGAVNGGSTPYTFAWQPATGLNNAASLSPMFTPDAPGTYTFTLRVNDGKGRVANDTVTVEVTGTADSGQGANIGGDNSSSAQATALVVDAGADRSATVGFPIVLQGSVSGGDGDYSISWSPAGLLVRSNTLTPTFLPNEPGTYVFTMEVTDGDGASDSDTVTVTVSEKTTLSELRWGANFGGNGYELLAEFTRAVDETTAERVSNYRISATEQAPALAMLGSDQRTVSLIFEDVALTPATPFDISVNGGIKDLTGSSVTQASNIPPISNEDDTTRPTVLTKQWSVNYAGGYELEIVFSEAMNRTLVESIGAYRMDTGSTTLSAFDATLMGDGHTVKVEFFGKALAETDTIDIGVLPIRDINGRPLEPVEDGAISENPEDADPPLIVEDGVRFLSDFSDGGYGVQVVFNEAMDRNSAADPTAYEIGGALATGAMLSGDGKTVTLTFTTTAVETGSTLSIDSDKVFDVNGNSLPAQTDLEILPADGTGATPGTPVLTWLKGSESDGYQLLARFNEAMDEETVEDTDNWLISGTSIHPTSVEVSSNSQGDEIAGRTAVVTFGSFGFSDYRLGRSAKIDVSVDDSILDVNGDSMPEVSVPVYAHAGDTAAPVVVEPDSGLEPRPVWGDVLAGGYDGAQYVISLRFSETMDADSCEDPDNYYMAGLHPTRIMLDDGGTLARLYFVTTPEGLAIEDKLQIQTSVRDINGRSTTSATPLDIQPSVHDLLVPGLDDYYWSVNKSVYEVAMVFDEVMDRGSASDPQAYMLGDSVASNAKLTPDGKSIMVEFANGVYASDAPSLNIIGEIKDINGRLFDGSRGEASLPGVPGQQPTNDTDGPEILEAVWAADSLDYRVIVTFNEAVDATSAAVASHYELGAAWTGWDAWSYTSYLSIFVDYSDTLAYMPNTLSFPTLDDIFTIDDELEDGNVGVTATSATPLPGGTQVEVAFPVVLNSTSGHIGTYASTATLSVVAPMGVSVTDMHGNTATSSTMMLKNPEDFAAQPLLFGQGGGYATWAADYSSPYGGYALSVTFSNEVLDTPSAEDPANYLISATTMNPQSVNLSSFENLNAGQYAGRTVMMIFSGDKPLKISDTLDVSIGGNVKDVNNNGLPPQLGIEIFRNSADTTPPTAEVELGELPGLVVVTFSEAMDETSSERLDGYILDPDGAAVSPVAAKLSGSGRVVTLQFLQPVEGLALKIDADSVADINSNPVEEVTFDPFEE
jgi:hypothetical protein